MSLRVISVSVMIAVAVVAVGVWLFFAADKPAAKPQPSTQVAVIANVEDIVSATGTLQPRDAVDVGAQVSGQLKAIHVTIGQVVKAGDLVAEIDPAVLIAKVEAGKAQLAGLRAQLIDKQSQAKLAGLLFDRQARLRRDRATSEEAYESSEASARSAAAQVEMLEAQIAQLEFTLRGDEATLGYTSIRAPMTGTVVSLPARKGQTLIASQQAPLLMRIADLSTMTVLTQVSEADIPRLKIGKLGSFSTLGEPNRRWSGELRQILPTPEVVNNVVLYTALFDVSNASGDLLPQMTAQVSFVVNSAKGVVVIPASALATKAGKPSVSLVMPDGAIETRSVEPGVANRQMVEIRQGLKAGDRVVTRPAVNLPIGRPPMLAPALPAR